MNEAFKAKVQAFINSHVNQAVDFDGYYGAQCVDLVQFYNRDVVGNAVRFSGNAKDIYGQNPNGKYRMIQNTPSFVPQAGDIVVWNSNLGSGYGHIAVCTGVGDTNTFQSLDQNWNRPQATLVTHNYNNLLGFMRPLESESVTPTADDIGVVQGDRLRGRSAPSVSASVPWFFDDQEKVKIVAKTTGDTVTGKYGTTNVWYLVHGLDANAQNANYPQVWVSDSYLLTTKTPANVPDYKAPEAPKPTYSPRPATGLHVIDVSEFQGDIDWQAVKDGGVDAAIIRAGHKGPADVGGENRTDSKFIQNRDAARAVGLPIHFYWYIFTSDDPEVEAVRCANSIGAMRDGEAIWLDLEDTFDAGFDLNGFIEKFYKKLDSITGRTTHGYTYSSYASSNNPTALVAGDRRLWLANYNNDSTNVISALGETAVMHQYTSSGSVKGINGKVDLNVFFGSIADFKALGAITIPASPEQPGTTTNPNPTPSSPSDGSTGLPLDGNDSFTRFLNLIIIWIKQLIARIK